MAFQLNLPQFAPFDPLGSIAQGYAKRQETNNQVLQQQLKRKELESYDQVLNAELAKMLAATEATQAQTQHSRVQTQGSELDNMIKQMFGGQQAQADINYKNAIGSSAMHNADIAAINAQIAQQKLPGQLSEIELANQQALMMNQMMIEYMNKMKGNPTQNRAVLPQQSTGQVALPPIPGMDINQPAYAQQANVPVPAAIQQNNIGYASEQPVAKTPMDYLPVKEEEQVDFGKLFIEPKFKTETQKQYEQAYAHQEGKNLSNEYAKYSSSAAEAADIAGKQSSVIQQLKNSFANIPDWNKGEILGYLKDIPSESQLYEAIKSGAVMEVLALQKGVQNENDRKAIEKTYGSRTMDEVSMKELLTIKDITNDRLIEKNDFVSQLVGEKRSPSQVEAAWQKYINENSIYDSAKYQAYLQDKWSNMSPLERIEDEEKYLKMREDMLTIEISKPAGSR